MLEIGDGGGWGSWGPGPVCWALPAAPKLRGSQGGGHCHTLAASGRCQAWHGLSREGVACSFQESQACRKRGRAGATQVPNGFQAPTLKAGVSCRLSSCAPFWRLVWPFLGAGGGGGQLRGQRGSEQPSCSSSSGPGAPGGAYAHVWEGVGPGPQGSFSGETHPLAHQEPCTPRFNRTLPSSHPSPQPTHPSHNTALGTKAHRALVTHTLTHNSPAWLQTGSGGPAGCPYPAGSVASSHRCAWVAS